MEDNFDYKAYLKNNPLLKENEETEIGGKEDVEFADIVNLKPYDGILMQVRADWGKDSDLYQELLQQYVGEKLNFPKVISILKNYDVYDEYKHFFDMNENKIPKSGLMVFGKTQLDNNKIKDFVSKGDYTAEWNPEGFWFFEEDEELYDELENNLSDEFSSLDINARFEGIFESINEEQPLDNKSKEGHGSIPPTDREEAPKTTSKTTVKKSWNNYINNFLNKLEELSYYTPGDEVWDEIHNIIYEWFPANYKSFNEMWDQLKNNKNFIKINKKISSELAIDINDELEHISYMLQQDEDDLNEIESKVEQKLKEMSMTGGGGAGASFTDGIGMNYATPKAFKKVKKKK